jgi:hypothetical protein
MSSGRPVASAGGLWVNSDTQGINFTVIPVQCILYNLLGGNLYCNLYGTCALFRIRSPWDRGSQWMGGCWVLVDSIRREQVTACSQSRGQQSRNTSPGLFERAAADALVAPGRSFPDPTVPYPLPAIFAVGPQSPEWGLSNQVG